MLLLATARGSLRVQGADVAEVNVQSDATPVTAKAVRKDGLRVLTAATRFTISEKDNVPPLDPAGDGPPRGGPAIGIATLNREVTLRQPEKITRPSPFFRCTPRGRRRAPQNKQNGAFPFARKNLRSSVSQRPTTTTLCCPLSLSSSFSPPLWPRIPARPEPTTGKTDGFGELAGRAGAGPEPRPADQRRPFPVPHTTAGGGRPRFIR